MSNNMDRLALRAIAVLSALIVGVFAVWRLAPIVQTQLSEFTWFQSDNSSEAPSPSASRLIEVAKVPTLVGTPKHVLPRKNRTIAEHTPISEPEVRKAVPVAKPSAKFLPAPTPVSFDWQGRPWVNRHASNLDSNDLPPESPLQISPTPSELQVQVPSGKWSKLVSVPPNRRAFATFSIGRMRVECNGKDLGVFYRKPTFSLRRNDPEVLSGSISPFAMLDRTPRTLQFALGTHSLRFLSLEKKSETVSVEIRD